MVWGGGGGEAQCERKTDRDRERETEAETGTDNQPDRQRQTDRQTESERETRQIKERKGGFKQNERPIFHCPKCPPAVLVQSYNICSKQKKTARISRISQWTKARLTVLFEDKSFVMFITFRFCVVLMGSLMNLR